MAEADAERFRSSDSQVGGVVGLVFVGLVLVIGIVDRDAGFALWLFPLCGLVGVLIWASLLRPSVAVDEERLVLRNMLDTVSIPLAAVEEVAVGQMLAVRAGGKRYLCSGLSRSRRQAVRDDRTTAGEWSYGGVIEVRLRQKAEDARTRAGVAPESGQQAALAGEVRRTPALVEIGLLAVFGVLFVVTLFV